MTKDELLDAMAEHIEFITEVSTRDKYTAIRKLHPSLPSLNDINSIFGSYTGFKIEIGLEREGESRFGSKPKANRPSLRECLQARNAG
jgi:hypothetical protein